MNGWSAIDRSFRQTPIWAQSLSIGLFSLGTIALIGGIFFRIDEVVSVGGQLRSIGGTVEVESPAGGKISESYFADGDKVTKGQLLVKFDTRQASEQVLTLKNMIKATRSN